MELPSDYICEGQMNIWECMMDATPLKFDPKKELRLIELFAGIGSQAMCLRNIGKRFKHHKMVEFDRFACASYNAIHGTDFPVLDITKITGKDLEIVEKHKYEYLLTYSFPCTDLSCAGAMRGMEEGSGTRSSLLWEVKRLLEEVDNLPDFLLMENVPMVHSTKNIKSFNRWLSYLESRGYTTMYADLNAKNYGIPQSRNRTFAVSWLGDHTYKFPQPIPSDESMKDYLEDKVDEKYYIKNQKAWNLIDRLVKEGKIPTEQNRTEQNRTEQGLTYHSATQRQPMSAVASRLDTMVESISPRTSEQECLRLGYMGNEHQSTEVFGTDAIAPCIDATGYKHPMMITECKRL